MYDGEYNNFLPIYQFLSFLAGRLPIVGSDLVFEKNDWMKFENVTVL